MNASSSSKTVTLRDVAAASGVSATTASRVLSNNGYPVNAATRERILQAAKELNYVPVSASRTGDEIENEIAVLVPTVSNPFYASLITGFEGAAAKEGYRIFQYNTAANPAQQTAQWLLKGLPNKKIKGLAIATTNVYPAYADQLKAIASHNIKIVLMDRPSPNNSYNSVYFDYEKGSYIGTEYLIERGHRNIIYAGLELERESRVLRLQGFRNAMRDKGVPCGNNSILLLNDSETNENTQIESGRELARRMLLMDKLPSAVVAMNDMVAFGILRHFLQSKLRVPEDISILGFDDSIYCELSFPALTTIKVQSEQMGRMAAMLLLDDIRGAGSSTVGLALEPVIVTRDSVADYRE